MQFPPVEATTVYDQSNGTTSIDYPASPVKKQAGTNELNNSFLTVKVNPNGFSFHISVFGDQRVGKSSLISRLKNVSKLAKRHDQVLERD